MPPGACGEGVKLGDFVVVWQKAERVPAKRVAEHIKRHGLCVHVVNSRCKVLISPVQIGHPEPSEGCRFGKPDATVVQRQGLVPL